MQWTGYGVKLARRVKVRIKMELPFFNYYLKWRGISCIFSRGLYFKMKGFM
jgi:hypothetical protein